MAVIGSSQQFHDILFPNGQIMAVTNWGPFQMPAYDHVDVTYPDGVTEIYDFSFAGTHLGFITLIYADSTKARLVSADRT